MRRFRTALGVLCTGAVAAACPQTLQAPAPVEGASTADATSIADDASIVDANREAFAPNASPDAATSSHCPKRPDPSKPAPFLTVPDVNGMRLHAQYLVGADGSRFLWTLRDVGLGVDCWPGGEFARATALGPMTCKPPADPTSGFFTDATCTTHLWSVTRGRPPPPRAGARVAGASPYYYRPNGANPVCGVYGVASDQLGVDFYLPGPDILPGSLVTLAPSAPSGVPGEAIIERGADGSSFWLGAAATYGMDATSSVIALAAPSPMLLPPPLGLLPFATTTPLPEDSGCAAAPYDVIGTDSGAGAWSFAAVDAAPVVLRPMTNETYSWIGAPVFGVPSCVRSATSDGRQFQIEPCNASELVSMTSARAGGTRLGRDTPVIGPAAFPVPSPRGLPYRKPIDSATGAECLPYPASDGVLRCIDGGGASLYYADAACTEPVADSGYLIGTHITHWLNGLVFVHAVTGNVFTPDTLYYFDGATCFSVPVPPGTFTTLSPEIPPSSFVAVTLEE